MLIQRSLAYFCFIIALQLNLLPASAQNRQESGKSPVSALARKHAVRHNRPAPGFLEGALLGNGAMGVVVTTRPDAIVLYFGHNNVWDIRLAENNLREIGTFKDVFEKVKQLPSTLANLTDDPWYNNYSRMAGENYSKPYPRPFPCGSVILGFDPVKTKLIGHSLDISNGWCTVQLLRGTHDTVFLNLFTDMRNDQLFMQLLNSSGQPQPGIFNRIRIIPDPSTPAEFPKYEQKEDLLQGILSFRQTLPFDEPHNYKAGIVNPRDKAFRLTMRVNTPLIKTKTINWNGNEQQMATLEAGLAPGKAFAAVVSLQEGLKTAVTDSDPLPPSTALIKSIRAGSQSIWNAYWSRSSVQLADPFLEEIWYRNLYFLNCSVKEGVTCPGLFANWSYNNIGTAWHGDYHMNYNTQQPFWVTFSSNHLEKNLPYVKLIESLMPVSRKWANDYYGLPGAYFPHSAYPVEMTMNPYPLPDWGWEVSETPWAVQGLWWHYLYSGDTAFLRQRAYEPIKAAVTFLAAYMKRPDAHSGERWHDSVYHIFPTIPPELYGLRPGFQYNYDCATDLTLTKFMFNAFKSAVALLGTATIEQDLLEDIKDIMDHFPEYPTSLSAEYGRVMVSVPGEHDKVVYNVPNALITVFPGEDYGLHSDTAILHLLRNTYMNQQTEGGNDLVFKNMQAARIGILDLEDFKRQVTYCLLPNGTATDMVTQTKGRYSDGSDFGYMKNMGIWFENFALPAVINECLLQSYNGTIRLFPSWPLTTDARFYNLRAAGGFLVSATLRKGQVVSLEIFSEKGHDLQIVLPWSNGGSIRRSSGKERINTRLLVLKTRVGEKIRLYP